MTPKEPADALEKADEENFASLLWDLQLNHDDEPGEIKTVTINALRFSDQHELSSPRPPLDEADQIRLVNIDHGCIRCLFGSWRRGSVPLLA